MSDRPERDDDDDRREGQTDRGGTYYSAEGEADEAAADLGRRQGPGAESSGETGSGGPGSTSQKSRGG